MALLVQAMVWFKMALLPRSRYRRGLHSLVWLVALILLLAGKSAAGAGNSSISAQANPDNFAVEGQIWSTAQSQFVDIAWLTAMAAAADVFVIGESHGHHAHQDRETFLVQALADRRIYPAVVLEMLDASQAEALARSRERSPESVAPLPAALNWAATGWPAFEFYRNLFQAAYDAKLPIIAGDLPKSRQDDLRSGRLQPPPVSGAILQSWRETMLAAHCGLLSEPDLTRVAGLQVERDRSMASALESALHDGKPVILVAGLSHIRRDRSVPLYLAPELKSFVLALMEVSDRKPPQAYLPQALDGERPVYDAIWFTPARKEEGACDRLRRKGLIR